MTEEWWNEMHGLAESSVTTTSSRSSLLMSGQLSEAGEHTHKAIRMKRRRVHVCVSVCEPENWTDEVTSQGMS